jgi:hypothetical protein
MSNEHEEGFSDSLLERLRTLTKQEAQALLAEVVPWEGEMITMENALARLMIKASRCPELSRETRDNAFRLAKNYLKRLPRQTVEVYLYADDPAKLKDQTQ